MDTVFKSLMKYAKSEDFDFKWDKVRDNVLGVHYHEDMKCMDVFRVVHSNWEQLCQEPRYELGIYSSSFELLCAPSKKNEVSRMFLGTQLDDLMTMEEIYNSMLYRMMYAFRFARVDWCSGELNEKL